jgi:hypothetical protein
MSGAIPLLFLYTCMACRGANLHLPFIIAFSYGGEGGRCPKICFHLQNAGILFWHSFVYDAECHRPVPTHAVQSYFLEVIVSLRSQWPRGLRHGSAAARLLRLWVPIPPTAWMSVSFECCVL